MSNGPGKHSALEALQKIKEAEAEAKKIILEAREKTSVKIIDDADKDADQIRERILDEARREAREKKNSIIQEAQDEVKRIAEETQSEIDRLHKRSASAKSKAVARRDNCRSWVSPIY
jgi:V/A-type H+-transporting ATPase subunit G/H